MVTEKNSLTNTTENKVIASTDKTEQRTTSNHHSTPQQQLLILAETFSLNEGLLPINKQAPITDRTDKRRRLIQQRQQLNLEAIISKAMSYCNDENAVNKADPDWFVHFIELAESISNKTMQALWAKILASEVNHPGTFGLKTLAIFRAMSIHDAKLFAKACSIACNENQKRNFRIINGSSQQPSLWNIFSKHKQQAISLHDFGLSYGDILSLAENQLIYSQHTESNIFTKNQTSTLDFNGINLTIRAQQKNCVLNFYKFTPAGTELARLINNAPNQEYLSSLKNKLQHHFAITSE